MRKHYRNSDGVASKIREYEIKKNNIDIRTILIYPFMYKRKERNTQTCVLAYICKGNREKREEMSRGGEGNKVWEAGMEVRQREMYLIPYCWLSTHVNVFISHIKLKLKSSLRKEASFRHFFFSSLARIGSNGYTPLPGCVGGECFTEQATPSNPIWTR